MSVAAHERTPDTQLAEESARTNYLLYLTLLSLCVCLTVGFIFYWYGIDRIVTPMYRGESIGVLNRLIHHADSVSLSDYLVRGRVLLSRLILLCIFAHMAIAAIISRTRVKQIVIDFFTSKTSPINLALFRIAVFAALLLDLDPSSVLWFSTLPHQLQIPPFGVAWLMPYFPVSERLAKIAIVSLFFACALGLVGLFTRISTTLALALSFYVLAIPQLYGKVSHSHDFVWFLAILAVSPAGDSLSFDSFFASIRRADKGFTEPPPASLRYSLPLRFASLLLGVIYLFPGFWKLWTSGFGWAFSENLKYQMYAKWMEFDGWTPLLRIDRHPLLYESAALGTLVFELSFIFLIFFPRLRVLAPLGGVIFHCASDLFMRIFFYDLLLCYVALFDVSSWFERLGRRLFPLQLQVFFDGDCRFCRRTIAVIRAFDVLDRITFVNSQGDSGVERFPDQPAPSQHFFAVRSGQTFVGFLAYRAIAIRMPVLWPILPFLFFAPVASIGDYTYRQVARSRTCNQLQRPGLQPVDTTSASAKALVPVVIVGMVLLAGNIYCGARHIMNGWPFACYPTFATVMGNTMDSLEVTATTREGEILPLDTSDLKQEFTGQRLRGLFESLLVMRDSNPNDFKNHVEAFWQLYVREDPRLETASTLRIYRVSLLLVPEQRYLNPVRRELILEMQL